MTYAYLGFIEMLQNLFQTIFEKVLRPVLTDILTIFVNFFTNVIVRSQSIMNFCIKVKNSFITAFPCNLETIMLPVNMLKINADTFADSNSGSQQQ